MNWSVVISLIVMFASISPSFATDSEWSIRLNDGYTVLDTSIRQIDGDSLKIHFADSNEWINVDSIAELRVLGKSDLAKSLAIAITTGASIFASLVINKTPQNNKSVEDECIFGCSLVGSGLFGGVLGWGLSGIMWGFSSQSDSVYHFSKLTHEKKIESLHWIYFKANKEKDKHAN
jgi:hypothetical protein